MNHKITKNISRIELHDSEIIGFNSSENYIIFKFDWAKIDNYEEGNLGPLVLGVCELRLKGIRDVRLVLPAMLN